MKILTEWLRSYLPPLDVTDARLAEDLTLRGIAVEGTQPSINAAGELTGSLFDMDITTNRVDAMCHYGIAREAAAIYNLPLQPRDTTFPEAAPGDPYPVHIAPGCEQLCGRFTAQIIRGVTIAPTTGVLVEFFADLGHKLISNAVDSTNAVLIGIGHPTHAFDLDKISGPLTIRLAHPGEQLPLLDGSTRTLTPEDLVIADDRQALSLAGIMGGASSMITAHTKNILVESAWFDPATIRASSRRHLIHTDASHRFERGADFAAAPLANAAVCRHIVRAAGGRLHGPLTDVVIPAVEARTATRPPITLSVAHTQRLLGQTLAPEGITAALIQQFLTALGCTLTASTPDSYEVTLPSWRLDLTRDIDLIEEIARVYGYNGFANTLPSAGITIAHPTAAAEQAVRQRLLALGFTEALSSTFSSEAESILYAGWMPPVRLENPLSAEAANLRSSLLPGMVTMLANNLTRDVFTARLFETGAIFRATDDTVEETLALSLGLTGTEQATPIHIAQDAPFFELKGALESLFPLFELPAAPALAPATNPIFEPGRQATYTLAGRTLATFGQLAVTHAAARKLRQPLYLAQVDLALLLAHPLRQPLAQELSRFQAVQRDFSFTFPDTIQWQTLASAIHALAIPELQSLEAVEVFRDPKRLPGKANILLRTTFQSPTRTLTESDLTHWWATIIATLESLGGIIRDH